MPWWLKEHVYCYSLLQKFSSSSSSNQKEELSTIHTQRGGKRRRQSINEMKLQEPQEDFSNQVLFIFEAKPDENYIENVGSYNVASRARRTTKPKSLFHRLIPLPVLGPWLWPLEQWEIDLVQEQTAPWPGGCLFLLLSFLPLHPGRIFQLNIRI